ncbi:hypothetical protein NDU88_008587 [Pleurodeles waltl]|uniref:Uncharacterized protein n=1 Tax=Pleurodeles waltl TaxID=8319 RepID=A0AAV7RTI6_PLEWA|nr:hypothetical protein NDU88_008587 [Pleurodeles waltl]
MTHSREAEPENDAQPDLRKKLTPGSENGANTSVFNQNTQNKQQSSRAATGSHGGDSNPAYTQTQKPAATTAATTTPAGTPKAAHEAGEDIPPKNNPSGPQGTQHHTEVPVGLAGHSAAASAAAAKH